MWKGDIIIAAPEKIYDATRTYSKDSSFKNLIVVINWLPMKDMYTPTRKAGKLDKKWM
jgi:hypothetical protein